MTSATKTSTSYHGGIYYPNVFGLQPSKLIDMQVPLFQHNKTTALGLSEQLYTARGSQANG